MTPSPRYDKNGITCVISGYTKRIYCVIRSSILTDAFTKYSEAISLESIDSTEKAQEKKTFGCSGFGAL